MSSRYVEVVDSVMQTHMVNPDHVVRIGFTRDQRSVDGLAYIILSNGEHLVVSASDYQGVRAKVAGLTGEPVVSGVELDRPHVEDDRYLVLLVCGHWVHTRIPDALEWPCPVIGGSHGNQAAATTPDGKSAVLDSWDLWDGDTSA